MAQSWQWMPQRKLSVPQNHWVTSRFCAHLLDVAARQRTAAKLDGVAKVLCADDAAYGNGLAEPVADLIVSLAGDYEHIVAPATNSAKNILPRVAAMLDVMVITDVTAVVNGNTFERPIYAGNAIQTVESADAKKVISFRTANFDAAGEGRFSSCRRYRSGEVTPDCQNGLKTKSQAAIAQN
jgi:electron transfer flavoprotein alpha subunit